MKFKPRNMRYLNLLVVIIAMMVISPFVSRAPLLRAVNDVVLSLVLFSVLYAVKEHRMMMVVGLCLGLPWVLLSWINFLDIFHIPAVIMALTSLIFNGYLIFVLLRHIVKAERVDADILYGAFSVYIMLGIFFTFVYVLVQAASADATVVVSATGEPASISELFYFSFVTLTTLGYGDILPMTDAMRILVILEAMFGVFYTAALVGKLVGLYVSQAGEGSVPERSND